MSTLVNHQVLQPYVFRNYCLPPGTTQNFYGSSSHKLWEALQASSAAPGFFEECKLGPDIHQVKQGFCYHSMAPKFNHYLFLFLLYSTQVFALKYSCMRNLLSKPIQRRTYFIINHFHTKSVFEGSSGHGLFRHKKLLRRGSSTILQFH